MNSLILRTTLKLVLPLLMFFSVFLLVQGHHDPGGGFTGGLVAAAAFALHSIAHGPEKTRTLLRADPRLILATGLAVSALSGLPSLFAGREYLTGLWGAVRLGGLGRLELGTPLLFDFGVYLLVFGWNKAFWKPAPSTAAPASTLRRRRLLMYFPLVSLALLTVLMGVAFEPCFEVARRAAVQLLDPGSYVRAVMGAMG